MVIFLEQKTATLLRTSYSLVSLGSEKAQEVSLFIKEDKETK